MNQEKIREIEEAVANNPNCLLGAIFLCPHCNRQLKVIRVSPGTHASYDPSGQWSDFVFVQLEDGEWARFWLREYPDTPYRGEDEKQS